MNFNYVAFSLPPVLLWCFSAYVKYRKQIFIIRYINIISVNKIYNKCNYNLKLKILLKFWKPQQPFFKTVNTSFF